MPRKMSIPFDDIVEALNIHKNTIFDGHKMVGSWTNASNLGRYKTKVKWKNIGEISIHYTKV